MSTLLNISELKLILSAVISLIAFINPISKVFILSSFVADFKEHELSHTVFHATFLSALILLAFAWLGNFIMENLFHVKIYSFQIIGGLVLVFRGMLALNKGVFFELNHKVKLSDLSIVPLAAPMIGGPATISASMAFPSQYGLWITSLSIVIALIINLIIMFFSGLIYKILSRLHLIEALIRITGLIVATIGVQMMSEGIYVFLTRIISGR